MKKTASGIGATRRRFALGLNSFKSPDPTWNGGFGWTEIAPILHCSNGVLLWTFWRPRRSRIFWKATHPKPIDCDNRLLLSDCLSNSRPQLCEEGTTGGDSSRSQHTGGAKRVY